MTTASGGRLVLLAGTREGLYRFDGTCERQDWQQRGPFLDELDVAHAVLDPRDGRTIWAAATGGGCTGVWRSDDDGASWVLAGGPFECDMVWHVEPGHPSHPRRVWAGVRPAGLYVSDDWGESWQPVVGLNEHPTAAEWYEGGGGKMLHSILTHQADPNDLTVAISVAGVFRSSDGGQSWAPSNDGTIGMTEVFTEFTGLPAQHPTVHRCVHKVVRHPERPEVLYQQNHDGVYRSGDGGRTWVDISAGLRDRFGFVAGVTRDGALFVVPQSMEQIRYSGQLEVWRLREGNGGWERLTTGLPQVENLTLYREGMATDRCLPGGVYFGTNHGDVFYSVDGGDSWSRLASGLPPVRSMSSYQEA